MSRDAIPLTKVAKTELADRWGALKARADKVDDEIEALKAEFERRGLTVVEGAKFSVVKSTRSFDSLKIREIRAEMGPAWCAARSAPQDRTTYEVRPLGGVKKKAARA